MSERKEILGLREFLPEVLREENLNYESQEFAKRMLDPVKQKLAERIKEEVKTFLDSKSVLPDTAKESYRNLDPFVVSIRYQEDASGDFLDKMEFKIQFVL